MKIHPSLFELCCSQTDKQTNKRRWKHYTADQWNEVLTYLHQSHPASAQWTCNERKDHLCPAVFQEAKNKRPRLGHATQKGRQRAGKADNPANEWQKSTATSASKPTKLAESRKALNKPHTNTHTHTDIRRQRNTNPNGSLGARATKLSFLSQPYCHKLSGNKTPEVPPTPWHSTKQKTINQMAELLPITAVVNVQTKHRKHGQNTTQTLSHVLFLILTHFNVRNYKKSAMCLSTLSLQCQTSRDSAETAFNH